MYGCVRLPEKLIDELKVSAKKSRRSISGQVEYLTRLGQDKENEHNKLARIAEICKHNPDFSYEFAEETLDAMKEKDEPNCWTSAEVLAKELGFGKDYLLEG